MLRAGGKAVTVKIHRYESPLALGEGLGVRAYGEPQLNPHPNPLPKGEGKDPRRCRAKLATALQIKSAGCAVPWPPPRSSNALAVSGRCFADES